MAAVQKRINPERVNPARIPVSNCSKFHIQFQNMYQWYKKGITYEVLRKYGGDPKNHKTYFE
jgi:hypothetical protein